MNNMTIGFNAVTIVVLMVFMALLTIKCEFMLLKMSDLPHLLDNDHLAGKMDLTCKIIGLCNTVPNRSFLIKILHIIYEQFQQEISFSMPLAECTFENQQLFTALHCAMLHDAVICFE